MNAKQIAALRAFDVAAAKTSELLALHNEHAESVGKNPTTRFPNRSTAERRAGEVLALVLAAIDAKAAKKAAKGGAAKAEGATKVTKKAQREAEDARRKAVALEGRCPACGAEHDITHGRVVERGGKQHEVDMHVATCHGCGHDFNHETGRPAKYTGGDSVKRSAAIAASWADPEVHARRVTRDKVVVNGVEYSSVRAAFAALGLPESKHIKFRMELKAAGRKAFDGVVFVTVKKD